MLPLVNFKQKLRVETIQVTAQCGVGTAISSQVRTAARNTSLLYISNRRKVAKNNVTY
jgi:hypothetical protein